MYNIKKNMSMNKFYSVSFDEKKKKFSVESSPTISLTDAINRMVKEKSGYCFFSRETTKCEYECCIYYEHGWLHVRVEDTTDEAHGNIFKYFNLNRFKNELEELLRDKDNTDDKSFDFNDIDVLYHKGSPKLFP